MAREPGPDRREEILGVLWPDRDEKRARRALNQLLYTLRKVTPQLDLESVEDAVDFGRDVWLDVEEFEARIQSGDLKGAVEMYSGPFLIDLAFGEPEFDHWADRQRAGLRREFRKAALKMAMDARAAADHDAAVGYCRRLIEADSLDDEAQHLLIECLYLKGDRLAALRQYDVYRVLLENELEVEPLEHTRELVARIRAEPSPGAQVSEPELEPDENEVEREPQPQVEQTAPAKVEAESAAPSLGLSKRGWVVAAVALVVVTMVAIWQWPTSGPAEDANLAARSTVPTLGMRVAVMPFQPHGVGADSEGLPEGVAQLLSVDLEGEASITTVGHLQVLQALEGQDAASAMQDAAAMRALAGDLGASAFVVGDIHRSGDEIRLVAELVDAQTGAELARADARGPRDGMFDLIERLVAELVQDLPSEPDRARQ
jgi:DNA-binding SARP family transcriptional activator/TolB-like protein